MPYIIPPEGKANKESAKIMLAIMAASGQGKTFSAMTFPSPVVANFDDNLQAFQAQIKEGKIQDIPFHDAAFCDKLAPRTIAKVGDPLSRPNKRDAFTTWLSKYGYLLEHDQTLVVDSWTICQDGFDTQKDLEPVYDKKGELNPYDFWGCKQDWSRDVLQTLKALKCHVVVNFHEEPETDDKGKVIAGKLRPVMSGKFVHKLGSYFSDWVRSSFHAKGTKVPFWKEAGMQQEVTDKDIGFWQTKSDVVVNCKSRMVGCPLFIPANYTSFKY